MFLNCLVLFIIVINLKLYSFEVSGAKSLLGYFPSQLDLKDASTGKHKCSGTLVEDKHVVTAAHCIARSIASELAVMGGDVTLLPNVVSTRETRHVLVIVKHPDYKEGGDRGFAFNIAILKLDMPFTRSNFLHPAVIPQRMTKYGTKCYLVGWNMMNPIGITQYDLLFSIVTTMEMEQCYKCVGNSICAGSNGKGPCINDEGGSLMCNGALYGFYIGSANSCQVITGIYTDVVLYKQWIEKIISWNGQNTVPLPLPNARERTFDEPKARKFTATANAITVSLRVLAICTFCLSKKLPTIFFFDAK